MASSEQKAALVAMATAGGMTPDAFRALGGVAVLTACRAEMSFVDTDTAIALGAIFPGGGGFMGGGPPNNPSDSGPVPGFGTYPPTYAEAAQMIARRMSVQIPQ